MAFTAACASFVPRKAHVESNLDRVAEIALAAATEGADLVCFPEAACTGYFLEGGVLEASQTSDDLRVGLERRLSSLTAPLDVVVGFYERHEGILYNAAAYIEFSREGSKTQHVYRKFFLPTYGVFDEERFVSRGTDVQAFDTRLGRMAILICEDVWHSILPTLAAVAGAQVLIVPSASPGRGFGGDTVDNHARYERLLHSISEEHGVFCLNAQLCGFEGGKGFVGGSMAIDPEGRLLVKGPLQEEHVVFAKIDLELAAIVRAQSPLVSDLQATWGDIRKIVSDLLPD